MLDPVTAFTVATTTFNTIKKAVAAGKEIEQVAGQLGKWWGALSDYNSAVQKASKPPLFKKLLHDGSIEQEALERTIHRQKLLEMERDLRELITYAYGQQVYIDMLEMRRKIKAERELAEKQQRQRQKEFADNTFWGIILVIVLGVAGYFIYLFLAIAGTLGK